MLLSDKTSSLYKACLKIVIAYCSKYLKLDFKPKFALCDFEAAMIKALNQTFPRLKVNGCLFHFTKSLFRRVQKMGLQMRFGNDKVIAQHIKMLMAMPFCKVEDVLEAFEQLKEEAHEDLIPLFEWFETNYIIGEFEFLFIC